MVLIAPLLRLTTKVWFLQSPVFIAAFSFSRFLGPSGSISNRALVNISSGRNRAFKYDSSCLLALSQTLYRWAGVLYYKESDRFGAVQKMCCKCLNLPNHAQWDCTMWNKFLKKERCHSTEFGIVATKEILGKFPRKKTLKLIRNICCGLNFETRTNILSKQSHQ